METAKLFLEYFKVLIWPIVVLASVMAFRKPISYLLNNIKSAEGFGIKAEFEKKLEEMNSKIIKRDKKVKEDIINIDEEVRETQNRISKKTTAEIIVENAAHDENSHTDIKIGNVIIDDGSNTMLAFAAGTSIKNNQKYRLYYDPASRSHNYPFKFIGLYANGEIAGVGKVEKVVVCNYDSEKNELISTDGKALNLTKDERDRIIQTIVNTDYYELEEGNRFFLVDNFYDTQFKKVSDGGLRAKKYFWLDDVEGFEEGMSAEELATLLNGKEWE